MKNNRLAIALAPFVLLAASTPITAAPAAEDKSPESVFAKENLVAWCIVPFDAKRRGPRQRAEMLKRLGVGRLAYDWRPQHVASFEEEILQMKSHGVEFFAFWGFHPSIEPLIKKHAVAPQIWQTVPSSGKPTQEERVQAAARQLLPLVEQTRRMGCKVGLYNHGGWGGEPENLAAVAGWLRTNAGAEHVGIVYNFHHGHGHIGDFAKSLDRIKPYLLCLNLNGMNDGARPKILPVGMGQHDLAMLEIVRKSGYHGPIGILDHRGNLDAEESLRQNLDGLKKLLKQMGDQAALGTYD